MSTSSSRLYKILIFFSHYRRESGDIMADCRVYGWTDYRRSNTVGRCTTVWNLSAIGVVTGPTSQYSCITCLRVVVSGILSDGLRTLTYIYVYVCTLVNSKCDGLSWYECNGNDLELSKPLICKSRSIQPRSKNYLFVKRSLNKR